MSAIRKEARRCAGLVASGTDIHAVKLAEREEAKVEKSERAAAKANTLSAYIKVEYAPQVLDHQGRSGLETFSKLFQVWQPLLDKDLKAITGEAISSIVQKRCKTVTIHTAARDLTTLRAALNHAVDAGKLAENPMPSRKKLLGTIPSDQRVRYLEPDERSRLNAALDDDATPGYIRLLVRLLLNTGLRRGEAFSLRCPTWIWPMRGSR
jgi:integrase